MPPNKKPVRSSEPRRALSSPLTGALVCGVCLLLAPPPCCGASSTGVKVTQVPLLDNEYVTIPAKVFGESICLVPDTGSDISYLDVRFRERLGAPLEYGTQRSAFRDKAGVAAYASPPLLVGETRLLPRLVGCEDMTMGSMISGQQCDGILGMNILEAYVICFDFDQRRFSMTKRVPEAIRERLRQFPSRRREVDLW